uniref:Uncharacterized protein n=1 Tax=Anguilla anguilla TaxID=7936 RepID=A0A0E9V063_ANGAN
MCVKGLRNISTIVLNVITSDDAFTKGRTSMTEFLLWKGR